MSVKIGLRWRFGSSAKQRIDYRHLGGMWLTAWIDSCVKNSSGMSRRWHACQVVTWTDPGKCRNVDCRTCYSHGGIFWNLRAVLAYAALVRMVTNSSAAVG
jgi:hypothetical protein